MSEYVPNWLSLTLGRPIGADSPEVLMPIGRIVGIRRTIVREAMRSLQNSQAFAPPAGFRVPMFRPLPRSAGTTWEELTAGIDSAESFAAKIAESQARIDAILRN